MRARLCASRLLDVTTRELGRRLRATVDTQLFKSPASNLVVSDVTVTVLMHV